jgi:hypothetical protein
MERQRMRRGDLVEWAPTGERGLWRITDLDRWGDAADADYASFEKAFAATTEKMSGEMADEVDRQILEELGVKVTYRDVPEGKVRLEWFSGWRGYEGNALPVIVRIEEVRVLTEMEVIGLASA